MGARTVCDIGIGRRPILDRDARIAAYELVGGGGDTSRSVADRIVATLIDLGIDALAPGLPVLLRVPADHLPHALGRLPAERLLLEVDCDRPLAAGAVADVDALARAGVRVVVRDPVAAPAAGPLLGAATVIRVETAGLGDAQLTARIRQLRAAATDVALLAGGVRTHAERDRCRALGFDLFQGAFLSDPRIVRGRRVPADRLVVLELLAALSQPEIEMDRVEAIVARDVALSYQLLRYVNSAAVGLRAPVESVRHALVLLGPATVRQLASLLLPTGSSDRPLELTRLALVRARMCEGIGAAHGDGRPAYYLAGLFSTLDALLRLPLAQVLASLPLHDEVVGALLSQHGPVGRALLATMRWEQCEWDDPVFAHYDLDVLTERYLRAVTFADDSLALAARSGN